MAQNYGEHADIRKRVKTQALLFRHFWTRWQKEYLTALCEFHCSTANSTETIRDGDIVLIMVTLFIVLIHPWIEWRLGIAYIHHLNMRMVDLFIP